MAAQKKISAHRCDLLPIILNIATGYNVDALDLSCSLRARKILARGVNLDAGGPGSAATSYYLEDTGSAVISFWGPSKSPLVAHESLHVAMWFSEYLGLPVSAKESEALAYVLEWAVKCVKKHMKTQEHNR